VRSGIGRKGQAEEVRRELSLELNMVRVGASHESEETSDFVFCTFRRGVRNDKSIRSRLRVEFGSLGLATDQVGEFEVGQLVEPRLTTFVDVVKILSKRRSSRFRVEVANDIVDISNDMNDRSSSMSVSSKEFSIDLHFDDTSSEGNDVTFASFEDNLLQDRGFGFTECWPISFVDVLLCGFPVFGDEHLIGIEYRPTESCRTNSRDVSLACSSHSEDEDTGIGGVSGNGS